MSNCRGVSSVEYEVESNQLIRIRMLKSIVGTVGIVGIVDSVNIYFYLVQT